MINLANLLKDHVGSQIYSVLYGYCSIDKVDDHGIDLVRGNIRFRVNSVGQHVFYDNSHSLEIAIFPSKNLRDWSSYVPKFKKGDIISSERSTFIFGGYTGAIGDMEVGDCISLAAYVYGSRGAMVATVYGWTRSSRCDFATEQEKEEFFEMLSIAGYRWNAEKLELEKE